MMTGLLSALHNGELDDEALRHLESLHAKITGPGY